VDAAFAIIFVILFKGFCPLGAARFDDSWSSGGSVVAGKADSTSGPKMMVGRGWLGDLVFVALV
jgi:hypothetical protein